MNNDLQLKASVRKRKIQSSGYLFCIQTVAPSQLTQLAKPLPQQEVNKGRIWGVFVGGAVVLFVTTVVAENNEAWFPAISRANKAMAMSRAQAQVRANTGRNVHVCKQPLLTSRHTCVCIPLALV
jgi:hypothetical protein